MEHLKEQRIVTFDKKSTEKLVEHTKTKPLETLEFKMNNQRKTFYFSPPINLSEEGKWLLTVTSFKTTNFVFTISDKNNSFSNTTSGHWSSQDGDELINELDNLLKLTSENDFELHLKQVEKRCTGIERENSG